MKRFVLILLLVQISSTYSSYSKKERNIMNSTTPIIQKNPFIGSVKVVVGAEYKHYKGKTYTIITKAWGSEGDKLIPMVVYQGQYTDPQLGEYPIFVQTEDRFLTTVTIDGNTIPRFTLLD